MRRYVPLLVLMLTPLSLTHAQATPKPIVLIGLKGLVEGRCRATITSWTSTWPEESSTGRQRLIDGCDDLTKFGALNGYDVIRVVDVTADVQRVYVLLRYDLQPVYLSLVVYAADTKIWKVQAIQWNSNPDDIIPPDLLGVQHAGASAKK